MLNKNIMKRRLKYSTTKPISNYGNSIKNYLKFLPSFIKASGSAFFVDSIVFTLLRPTFGTNYSAIISFLFGTITLFSVLRLLNISRIKSRKIGALVQLFIGLGSFSINIMILNILDYIFISINQLFYSTYLDKSFIYAFAIRFFSACVGFIWTSIMTNKFTFTSKAKKS